MCQHAAVSDGRNQYSQNILYFQIQNDSMMVLSIAMPTLQCHRLPGTTRCNQDHFEQAQCSSKAVVITSSSIKAQAS